MSTAAERADQLEAAGVDGDEPVGAIPPARLLSTARDLAANAVLAGCSDDAFPVVLAAVRACLQEPFNLLGILATTHPCGVATIVSGPLAAQLGINSGSSLYGPGTRMNATIGRAVRLTLQNLGRAWPGPVDKSTQGSPSKYSYCIAENLAASPWGPHHVERGFAADESTVTVLAAESPHNMHEPASSTADGLVQYFVGSMTHAGHNNLYHRGDLFLVLCPEHAWLLHDSGWDRERLRRELFARVRVPASTLGLEPFEHFTSTWPTSPPLGYDHTLMEVVARPEDIHIMVAGGPGKHSTWLPTFGLTYSSTERISW